MSDVPSAVTESGDTDTVSVNHALLGEVVSWDMRSTEVAYTTVRDALLAAGLDPDEAHEMMPRSAFGRACKHLKEERTIDKLSFDKGGIIKFQFTKKHLEGEKLAFDYECIVRLHSETGAIECHENPILEQHARELFAHAMQTRSANDVTRIIQRLFSKHADLYPINKRGIAYFVPERHRAFTSKVDAFLTEMGGVLSRFPVPKGTAEGNASVKDAVQAGLSTLLAELNETVATWDETTRKATMEKAAERYRTIAYKVDAYAEYLGSEQERLKDEMQKAKAELARKIQELKPEEQPEAAAA